MMKKISILAGILFCLCCTALYAQAAADDFGFESEAESSSAFSIDMGGKLSLGGSFYFNDFKTFQDVQPGSLLEGKLHVHATAPMTEAYFGVKLNGKTLAPLLGKTQAVFPEQPQIASWIDEAYLKMLFGSVVITGGIQKMNWGRAENLSVLDIVNPRDKTDLTLMYAPQEMKIARPLISATVYLPYDLKLEGVYLPVFEGNRIVTGTSDRWYSRQFDRIWGNSAGTVSFNPPVTDTLAYSQGGSRLTAAIGGKHDLGVQYFYGRLPELAFRAEPAGGGLASTTFAGLYNPYHHIGIDYGVGIGPVSLSAELAANITSDLSGNNPSIYNPLLAWNTGTVYSAPLGFTFSVNVAENIRLHHNSIGTQDYDVESGKKATDTKLAFSVSQTLLRTSFEWKLGAIVGIEDADFCIMPGIHWQFGTLLLDCNVGIFGGKETGSLGQFTRNSFIRLTAAYEF